MPLSFPAMTARVFSTTLVKLLTYPNEIVYSNCIIVDVDTSSRENISNRGDVVVALRCLAHLLVLLPQRSLALTRAEVAGFALCRTFFLAAYYHTFWNSASVHSSFIIS